MSQRIELLIVGLLAAIVLLSSLGSTKLWDRDEPRNAGCAREMLERGDLITPVFNSELRDAKPVFLYWVMIASYQLFGITEFAARFGSAFAGIGTVFYGFYDCGFYCGVVRPEFLILGKPSR